MGCETHPGTMAQQAEVNQGITQLFHSDVYSLKNWANLIVNGGQLEVESKVLVSGRRSSQRPEGSVENVSLITSLGPSPPQWLPFALCLCMSSRCWAKYIWRKCAQCMPTRECPLWPQPLFWLSCWIVLTKKSKTREHFVEEAGSNLQQNLERLELLRIMWMTSWEWREERDILPRGFSEEPDVTENLLWMKCTFPLDTVTMRSLDFNDLSWIL